ncbi:MAG: putative retaining b-glycosidase, glycoside hydrolase family 5 protein, partial [Bacteroidota bacterium]
MITQSNFPGATAEWKSATFPSGAIGQTNVRLRFLYSGSYYHWAIDDVTIFKPNINNLSINNTRYTTFGNTTPVPPNDFHDLPYDRYPKTMIVPFKFNAKATNIGSATQTSTNLNVKVLNSSNTALYSQTSSNSNVTAGATATYTLTSNYTPSTTTGYYRVAFQINQAQTDEVPSNNRDTLDYFITDYQYARDEGPMEDEFLPSSLYAGQTYQVGNIFEGRSNTVKCASIAVAVGPGTNVGTTIQAKIYKNDFTDLQATSDVYTVNAWDINSIGQQKLITLKLPNALQLYADSVYIVMVGNTVGSQAFRVCRSGAAIDQSSFVRYPENNGLFFLAKMPVVRMNIFTNSQTPGCTNPLANNYLPTANIDDGSCDVPGCINPISPNYNPTATWDDGSCAVYGCTIPTACNYSSLATVNNGSCVFPTIFYADSDQDSFGSPGSTISACSQPTGYVTNFLDCNDNNNAIKPEAAELCNLIDDNCNGQINEGLLFVNYYIDSDSDGFGAGSATNSCTPPVGLYVTNNSDCNDNNSAVRPSANETCNSLDDNCNNSIDEGLIFSNYFLDADLDGYYISITNACGLPGTNYTSTSTTFGDCNDLNFNINAGALEVCENMIDENCDGIDASSLFLSDTLISSQPIATQTICEGGSIEPLSVILDYSAGIEAFSYQWYVNSIPGNEGGAEISGATLSTYSPPIFNVVGTYYYYCVITLTGSGCNKLASNASQVKVVSDPIIYVHPTLSQAICLGETSAELAVAYVGGIGVASYQWYNNAVNSNTGGSPISGANSATYIPAALNSAGTYSYYAVITFSGIGCNSVNSQMSFLTVNSVSSSVIAEANSLTFCQGDSVVLNANTGTGLTYQWKLNGTNITGATSASYTATTSGSYTVTVTNASTCASTSTAKVVTVNALPIATITPTSATTFCQGGSVVFNANTGTGLSYQWRLNGNPISGATSSSYTANASGSYSVVVTNASTCSSTSAATVVTVNALPTATITPASATTFCQGGSVVLNAISVAGISYQWYKDSIAIIDATSSSYTAVASGSYKVRLTNASTCSSTSTATVVTVNALPTVTITPATATTFCQGGSVVLSANTESGMTYQWRLNGANIIGASSSSYTANVGGSYSVVVSSESICPSASVPTIVTVLSPSNTVETISACQSYDWKGQTYTASGTYTHNATSLEGCPYTEFLMLTIETGSPTTPTVVTGDSYMCDYLTGGTTTYSTPAVLGVTYEWV